MGWYGLAHPKEFVWERTVVEIALASPIISFNNGVQGLLSVFESCNVALGYFTTKSSLNVDYVRIKQMEIKSADATKNRRSKLRAI